MLAYFKSAEEAEALSVKENDPFYLIAFHFMEWLGDLLARARAEYAEKKSPRDRSLQNGEAWLAFSDLFADVIAKRGYDTLFTSMFRFADADPTPRNPIRHALTALNAEVHFHPDLLTPSPSSVISPPSSPSTAISPPSPDSPLSAFQNVSVSASPPSRLILPVSFSSAPAPSTKNPQPLIERLCDWIDAVIHFRIHRHWHLAPNIAFDPDPEIRYLAQLGEAQRAITRLDSVGRAGWLDHFNTAARDLQKSPEKWAAIGHALTDEPTRTWQYPDVDTLVITLWPLVKKYNWTYRDLFNVIRPYLKRPEAYPCDTDQSLSTYCQNVVGLKKAGRGRTATDGKPKGHEVANALCRLPEQKPTKPTKKE